MSDELQRTNVNLLQPVPNVFDPRSVLAGEETACRDVLRDARRAPCLGPIAACDRRLRTMQPFRRNLEIDPGVGAKRQLRLASPGDGNDATELRKQWAQGLPGGLLGPEGVQQLAAGDRAASVRSEIDEGKPDLTSP